MKITTRCGEDVIGALNAALVLKAAEAKVLGLHKVRADTTVVEANVAYPADSGLLAKGITRLARLARTAHAAGLAPRTRVRDRSRGAHRRARQVVNALRRRGDDARVEVARLNAQLARSARRSVREANPVVTNARRTLRPSVSTRPGRAVMVVQRLEVLASGWPRLPPRPCSKSWNTITPAVPPRSSPCMTPTRDRSAKAGSAVPSSSATKPKSSTTPTASSSTGHSKSATRPTLPNLSPPSNGSTNSPVEPLEP